MPPFSPVLVIGLGNALRGDDGVGIRVVETLAGEPWPTDVSFLPTPQLLIEHVDLLRDAGHVVFVDAAVDVPPAVVVASSLEPHATAAVGFHDVTPATLLALCQAMFGRFPRATLVKIGVESVETSTALSPSLEAAFDSYCTVVRAAVGV